MTLQEIIAAAEAPYQAACDAIAASEAAYYALHGHYYQLRFVPGDVPVDGQVVTLTATAPDDEPHPEDTAAGLTVDAPVQGRVDEWRRGEAAGWTLVARFLTAEGALYERRRTHTGSDSGWVEDEDGL